MLSSVLKSERAVQVNIQIMRAFVRLRELLTSNAELLRGKEKVADRKHFNFPNNTIRYYPNVWMS
jgi:hypothetical protein